MEKMCRFIDCDLLIAIYWLWFIDCDLLFSFVHGEYNKHKSVQKVAKVDVYTVCQSNKGANFCKMWVIVDWHFIKDLLKY